MKWEEKPLGEVVTLKRGYDLPTRYRIEGQVPIVSSSGITGYHDKAKAQPPGVVTGRYGTLGEVFYLQIPYWPLNTSLYVRDFRGNEPRFVYYFLTHQLRATSSDKAAVPGVNRNDLHAKSVLCPDIDEQRRIADILSAYDELIENNRRRIRLLEEAARLLYREWFVHLRFPGHENVAVVDGVPVGWERVTLGDKVELNYGKGLKKDDRIEGSYNVFGSSGIVGTHNEPLITGPGIIVGRKGNVGAVFWSTDDFYPIDTVYYVDSESSTQHTYQYLLNTRFENSDGAVPGLNRKYAYSRPFLAPPKSILQKFEKIASTGHFQIDNLKTQNEQLRQARDLLLPRLMRGEIAV